ncbi:MAG TPA: helix-turn-helix transcriptional regulator [Bryobacteraceae bacterium]|jgi:transcriptional regulator with XRE-family HTH domain|nr:helix-turn-helix transcriptional regulator [Bryobacteraceae bacterium]
MKDQQTNQNQNRLASFRRRRGYSQKRVGHLLGHKSHGALSSYERGRVLPTLTTALKLEIVLRTPVAFLFPNIYEILRSEIRAEEDRLAGIGQQDLFDHSPRQL